MSEKADLSPVNPELVYGELKTNFDKFQSIVDNAGALTPEQKAHFQKISQDLKNFESELENNKTNEIPNNIGVPFHAGANDVEPCL